jgi:hypothetical protein
MAVIHRDPRPFTWRWIWAEKSIACSKTLFRDIIKTYLNQIYWRNIMGAISLKLPEDVLEASRRCADTLHLSRAAYIRRAVERMNRQTQALFRARRLAEASKKVRKESMRVNREFSAIEQAPDA